LFALYLNDVYIGDIDGDISNDNSGDCGTFIVLNNYDVTKIPESRIRSLTGTANALNWPYNLSSSGESLRRGPNIINLVNKQTKTDYYNEFYLLLYRQAPDGTSDPPWIQYIPSGEGTAEVSIPPGASTSFILDYDPTDVNNWV
jgi:hypothetical protein